MVRALGLLLLGISTASVSYSRCTAVQVHLTPLILLPQQDARDSHFCKDILTYSTAALQNFKSLRGAPDSHGHGEIFESTRIVQGFSHCEIALSTNEELESIAVCADSKTADLEGLRSLLSNCLGAQWSSKTVRHSSDDPEYIFVNKAGVEIRIRHLKSGIELSVLPPTME